MTSRASSSPTSSCYSSASEFLSTSSTSLPVDECKPPCKTVIFEDCRYESIEINGEIHNSGAANHLPMLGYLLSNGIITPDKYVEMYASLSHIDKETKSDVSTVMFQRGEGKEIRSKNIYNGNQWPKMTN
ncbi:hypothetical protein BDQ17DRAFT_1435767 [Cyathus striatus]|nr:hypothetical protein BDQ17DRAFT_1435767 [Cyathus striatus]